jgi:hypothetical protein
MNKFKNESFVIEFKELIEKYNKLEEYNCKECGCKLNKYKYEKGICLDCLEKSKEIYSSSLLYFSINSLNSITKLSFLNLFINLFIYINSFVFSMNKFKDTFLYIFLPVSSFVFIHLSNMFLISIILYTKIYTSL